MFSRRDTLLSTLRFPGAVRQAPSPSAPAPGPRAGHVLAYHEGRRAICLLGGYQPSTARREQAWFWDGRAWSTEEASVGPGARSLAVAASDPQRKSILMFGGIGLVSGTRYGDLHELDARGAWTDRSTTSPGTLDHHAAAFDTIRGRLVVYGGQDFQRRWSTVVWEWDGATWHRIEAAPGPGGRAHHAMAFDSRRGKIVLVGGFGDGPYHGDTWEWDGREWRQMRADGPTARSRHRMAFDAERGVTVLFGGDTGNTAPGVFAMADETWLWNGEAWSRATPPASPPARYMAAMAYDPHRKRIVLHGGGTPKLSFADTWEWDGSAWQQVFAAPPVEGPRR